MQLPAPDIQRIIDTALAEDVGAGDVTSQLLMPASNLARADFITRQDIVVSGLAVVERVFKAISPRLLFQTKKKDGDRAVRGEALAQVSGSARELLTGERTALNLLQRMCGVATLTAQYVDAVKGTKAVILDTRKTMPGLRVLDKYAVTCGGGRNHRMGLYDMVLIKDNHIALAGGIEPALAAAKTTQLPIEVECESLAQVAEALQAGAQRIMLDNMDTAMLKAAVQLVGGAAELEASGNVTLENVRAIAQTGVDFISIGRITHSAPAVDIGMDIVIA